MSIVFRSPWRHHSSGFPASGSGLLFCVVTLVMCLATESDAGSPVYVGKSKAKLISMADIDHRDWDTLLKKYVDDDGNVDYRRWHASRNDRLLLDRYLDHLSSASRSSEPAAGKNPQSKATRLAFWINAYNAVTIKGILKEYPTSSIRNHTAKLWGYNIWHDLKLYVGHKPVSLDEIEHQILRKMNEPRIHFAIVCASVGCPRLLNQAYVGDRIEDLLEMNAKDFFARQQNFRHDVAARRFFLSAILKWFGEDFGSDQNKVLSSISKWLPTEQSRQSAKQGQVSVSYLDYDWALNSQ